MYYLEGWPSSEKVHVIYDNLNMQVINAPYKIYGTISLLNNVRGVITSLAFTMLFWRK